MQFLVIAKDGTDPDAPTRRQRVRDAHLVGAHELAERGALRLGGALLAADGVMIGSALLLDAEDEAEVRRLLEADVYHREGVWRSFEIYPFRQAI